MAIITVERAYQLSFLVKLTHHGTGLDWPILNNPYLLFSGQGAKGRRVGRAWGVLADRVSCCLHYCDLISVYGQTLSSERKQRHGKTAYELLDSYITVSPSVSAS